MNDCERPLTPISFEAGIHSQTSSISLFDIKNYTKEASEILNDVFQLLDSFRNPDDSRFKQIVSLNLTQRQTKRFRVILSGLLEKLDNINSEFLQKIVSGLSEIESHHKQNQDLVKDLENELDEMYVKYNEIEGEIKCLCANISEDPLALIENISKTLGKYNEFSREKFPKEQFSLLLDSFLIS